MSMIWPIALVELSNIVYQICAKGVPKDMDAMASMTAGSRRLERETIYGRRILSDR